MLTPRQEAILRQVVDRHHASGLPVGSKALAAEPALGVGPSTIRNELAILEERGLLAHPHTSAGRVPTDAGHRYYVDRLLEGRDRLPARALELQLIRREVDEAMRVTTETLSRVTNLLAVVSAPPLDTATIRHVEVLALQPQVLMVVIITSTGGVSKRVFPFERPVDPGLVSWGGAYLNEALMGVGLGRRTLRSRLADPTLGMAERAFLEVLAPAFTELALTAEDSLYVDGTSRLLAEDHLPDLRRINDLMGMLERRVSVLELLRVLLDGNPASGRGSDVVVRIGTENETPALQTMSLVASGYGLPTRRLGTVSVIGPVRMDYAGVIRSVREASRQLSRFIEDVYDPA